MSFPPPAMVRACALLALLTVLAMIALYLATGIGQDPLQFVHSPADYLLILRARPGVLRAVIGLDNLFIAFYAGTFLALSAWLVDEGAGRILVRAGLVAMLLTALLDCAENMHFLVMLARADEGVGPSSEAIAWQVGESMFKFQLSYVGLFLMGFALPRRTRPERTLSTLSRLVQLPAGVLIYVVPATVAIPLVFVRFAYFAAALALLVIICRRAPVASGSGAPR